MKFKTIFYLFDAILFPLLSLLLLFPPDAPGQTSQPAPVMVEVVPLSQPVQACRRFVVSDVAASSGRTALAYGTNTAVEQLDSDGNLIVAGNSRHTLVGLAPGSRCGNQVLQVDLFWTDYSPRSALGSTLTLRTSRGTFQKTVNPAAASLLGGIFGAQFDFPAETRLDSLEIHWPDGELSVVNDLTLPSRVRIIR